jgi:hypothetical protein
VTTIGDDAFRSVNDKFILQCGVGSAAEKYARKNKINYQLA